MAQAQAMTTPADVLAFWREAGMANWFNGGAAFDAECRVRFHDAHHAAARGECEAWLDDADGVLAALILLDQIPRNLFRGSGHAFATDGLARRYALHAVDAGLDAQMPADLRLFAYLPFEHAEDLADQDRAVALIGTLGDAGLSRYAQAHREVIARFGRFPHRNTALGRTSRADEQVWLDAGGGF
jgi:uncharacterized protein (DUF924 family)